VPKRTKGCAKIEWWRRCSEALDPGRLRENLKTIMTNLERSDHRALPTEDRGDI
jgi:hypothetical protein